MSQSYEDDDKMLDRIMTEAAPKIVNATEPQYRPPSWEAKHQGRTLGYFTTAEQAMRRVRREIRENA